MASKGKEEQVCLYHVLGVDQCSSLEEIRSSYRKLALKCHPDKIQQTGASIQERQDATARFQEIARAYEVLSDPSERAWYDSHRSQILSPSSQPGSAPADFDFNVWPFFSPSIFSGYGDSGKGFYAVYADVFSKIYEQEKAFARAYGGSITEPSPLGGPSTPYHNVATFYSYWSGFSTVKDFSWCDKYKITEAGNRKERRLMEEDNMKLRRKARREYNESVRKLASFVKKRDRRLMERQMEVQRRQKEKQDMLKLRQKQHEEEKIRQARQYMEPEWTKVSYNPDDDYGCSDDENLGSYDWGGPKCNANGEKGNNCDHVEPFCIICNKKFKSEMQWKNHEKSKKHLERVAALQDSFAENEDRDTDSEDFMHSQGIEDDLQGEVDTSNVEPETIGTGSDASDKVTNNSRDTSYSNNLDLGNKFGREGLLVDGTDEHDTEESLMDDEESMLEAMLNFQKLRQQEKGGERSSMEHQHHASEDVNCLGDEIDVISVRVEPLGQELVDGDVGPVSNSHRDDGVANLSELPCSRGEFLDNQHDTMTGTLGQDANLSYIEQTFNTFSLVDSDLVRCRAGVVDPIHCEANGGTLKCKAWDTIRKQSSTSEIIDNNKATSSRFNKKQKKGKKCKGSSEIFLNICKICGVEFESRNQLFKHINGANHSARRVVQ